MAQDQTVEKLKQKEEAEFGRDVCASFFFGGGGVESPDNHQVWFNKPIKWSWLTAQLSPFPSAADSENTGGLAWEHMWENCYAIWFKVGNIMWKAKLQIQFDYLSAYQKGNKC